MTSEKTKIGVMISRIKETAGRVHEIVLLSKVNMCVCIDQSVYVSCCVQWLASTDVCFSNGDVQQLVAFIQQFVASAVLLDAQRRC